MSTMRLLVSALVCLLACAPAEAPTSAVTPAVNVVPLPSANPDVADVPPPTEIVSRALAAQQPDGVKDRTVWCATARGTSYRPGGTIVFTMASCQEGPVRMWVETLGPPEARSLYVDDGSDAWEQTPAGVRAVPPDEMNKMRRYSHVDWVSTLWPLRQPGYRLTSLGRAEVGGAPAFGVKVSRDGELDVALYVDPRTWRVVKKDVRYEDWNGEPVYDESVYSAWKEADGVRYASHCEKLRNGRPKSVWDFEMRFPERIDEARFERPTTPLPRPP
jgi:hypothetical protein